MAGIDLQEMPAATALSVIYTMIVEEQIGPQFETTRHEARIKVDEWIDEGAAVVEHKPPPQADPETWGLLPEHQSGQNIALGIAGADAQ